MTYLEVYEITSSNPTLGDPAQAHVGAYVQTGKPSIEEEFKYERIHNFTFGMRVGSGF